ncbi:MAG: chemotaxis protein CheX, partial [Lachnospiraceae bacterium]|nr:chemotaxis protein CheX [Lachnospiraceae bacterium]
VGEFLNVCNGLYAVNESNESGIEISLTPLTTAKHEEMKFDKEVFSIPVQFTFGEIEFLVAF